MSWFTHLRYILYAHDDVFEKDLGHSNARISFGHVEERTIIPGLLCPFPVPIVCSVTVSANLYTGRSMNEISHYDGRNSKSVPHRFLVVVSLARSFCSCMPFSN